MCFVQEAAASCPGQNLLANPAFPGSFGPWPVGTVTLEGTLTARNL